MAQEKRTQINFSVVKDGRTAQMNVSLTEDLAGTLFGSQSQTVTTSYTALSLGTVTAADLICIRNNVASTHFIQVAVDDAGTKVPFSKIIPGRVAFFPADPSATYYVKADTASTGIGIAITEA